MFYATVYEKAIYPYGEAVGDAVVPIGDDDMNPFVDLIGTFDFFGVNYGALYVCHYYLVDKCLPKLTPSSLPESLPIPFFSTVACPFHPLALSSQSSFTGTLFPKLEYTS